MIIPIINEIMSYFFNFPPLLRDGQFSYLVKLIGLSTFKLRLNFITFDFSKIEVAIFIIEIISTFLRYLILFYDSNNHIYVILKNHIPKIASRIKFFLRYSFQRTLSDDLFLLIGHI